MPVISPCAPAAGCKVMASMPVISMSCSLSILHDAQRALRDPLRLIRMRVREAVQRATNSLTRALYFMVQEPSGYMP